MKKFIFCMLALFVAISSTVASAVVPPQAPILTIETGMHTASINRIATDADGRLLITASDDKTVRVWELPSGHLAQIIRPPIGEGNEGKLLAVALSPDGLTIACGGWTKVGGTTGHTIYLFNRESGAMTGRIPGLPNVINHLAFSPDGRYVAATLGKSGVRIFRSTDWSLAGEDKDYGNDSNYAHFSRDGLLVTTCLDGYLRLYRLDPKGLTLIAKKIVLPGSYPHAARFSPDGTRVAVGFDHSSKISVFSSRDMSLIYTADTKGVAKDDLTNFFPGVLGGY